MEVTHHHDAHESHEMADHGREHHVEDWNDEDFVLSWIERQKARAPERRRQFAKLRALIPRKPEDQFRYVNLGAGPGFLEEVLLEHFPHAQATLVDGSLVMLGAARQRLESYGSRVEYVQANLAMPEWAGAVSGPFDFALSSIAIHNLRNPYRIRALYAETYHLLGHGGMFYNLDYVRPARPSLAPLGRWVSNDAEADLSRGGGHDMPGTLLEQLVWLSEAGFACADVVWKSMNTVILCGLRDHLHMPEGEGEEHGHDHGGGEAHAAH